MLQLPNRPEGRGFSTLFNPAISAGDLSDSFPASESTSIRARRLAGQSKAAIRVASIRGLTCDTCRV